MPIGGSSHDPGVAKLVDRQVRNWEIARTQRLGVPAPQRAEVEDFISVSRSVGAGGREVASLLGEKLGWPVFHKELLDHMAGDDELRRRIYKSMDERDMGWCEETLRSLLQPEFVKNDYFHRLTETVLSRAGLGHAVFLGRAAHLIRPTTVGFGGWLGALLEPRVDFFASRYNLTADEARIEVARLEQQRTEFVQNHFRIDAADPTRHDLTLNLARFTPAEAVDLILSARTTTRT